MAQIIATKPPKTGGDDLDDGLELDPDLLASSDVGEDEDRASGSGSVIDDDGESVAQLNGGDDEEEGVYDDQEDEGETTKFVQDGRKRKANGEGEDDETETAGEKKRRKKEKEKERKARRRQQETAAALNNPPTHFSVPEVSALLLQSIRESFRSATTMELDDLIIPNDRILPPADYSPPQINSENPFEPLLLRLDSLLKPLQKWKLRPAQPRVIILALSGLRCADIVREVRGVKGDGEVAKLFAKHFKTVDQAKYLAKTKVSIAVGTPGRVGKLLAEDAIKVTKDTVVLLEVSHQDSKTRTLLNLPEVRDELWKSVFSGPARLKLLTGGARVGVF